MDSVIVTGSGTGLGRATAVHLAGNGYRVYATVPDLAQAGTLEEAARRAGASDRLRILEMDITSPAGIESAIQTVLAESGPPYALVNNAGIGLRGFFEDLADEEIRRLFDVNIFGTMAVTRAVLPSMREARRGRIVMISSIGGRIASLGISTYCATKFAQEGFAETLYQELRPFGIHVTIVEPAITRTERWDVHRGVAKGATDPASPYRAWFQRAEELANRMVETTPTRPEHVAEAILRILKARRPRLRVMVGSRARLVYALRRYVPERLFERLYFGEIIHRVTLIPRGRLS